MSVTANAASSASISNASCSGIQMSTLTDVARFSCTGDYSLFGGRISSDVKVVISADGALNLNNLNITAPLIELTSLNDTVNLLDGVVLNASEIFVTDARVVIFSEFTPQITTVNEGLITINPAANESIFLNPPEELHAGLLGGVNLSVGGSIQIIASPVPLPGTFLLMLFGIPMLKRQWQKHGVWYKAISQAA
ncbi:MAG: hypothetical protein WC782_10985 [Methylococcaceae bacterium]